MDLDLSVEIKAFDLFLEAVALTLDSLENGDDQSTPQNGKAVESLRSHAKELESSHGSLMPFQQEIIEKTVERVESLYYSHKHDKERNHIPAQ